MKSKAGSKGKGMASDSREQEGVVAQDLDMPTTEVEGREDHKTTSTDANVWQLPWHLQDCSKQCTPTVS